MSSVPLPISIKIYTGYLSSRCAFCFVLSSSMLFCRLDNTISRIYWYLWCVALPSFYSICRVGVTSARLLSPPPTHAVCRQHRVQGCAAVSVCGITYTHHRQRPQHHRCRHTYFFCVSVRTAFNWFAVVQPERETPLLSLSLSFSDRQWLFTNH